MCDKILKLDMRRSGRWPPLSGEFPWSMSDILTGRSKSVGQMAHCISLFGSSVSAGLAELILSGVFDTPEAV